jgi:DNA polymerase-3 subunit epsilon
MFEVVIDTETTGLSVLDGHRVVEVGCIELNNQVPTKKVFHHYLNPQRVVSKDAFKIHGYTDDFLAKQKKFSDIADDFLAFIDGKKLIIHNASFDIGFLNNELKILGKKLINKENIIDTLEIARQKYPGSSASLDALCKRYKIDNSKRQKHSALIDCELLTNVYINLIDQKEPKLAFIDGRKNKNKNLEDCKSDFQYSKKIVKPTELEFQLHKDFLKAKVRKNFYH